MLDRNVNIITDLDGKKFVLINDIRFKAKRREDWENVETYLKEYSGSSLLILTPPGMDTVNNSS